MVYTAFHDSANSCRRRRRRCSLGKFQDSPRVLWFVGEEVVDVEVFGSGTMDHNVSPGCVKVFKTLQG